ncbi:putative mycofactocin-associated electron transfer flavoprotein [Frankia sp. Cas4]|uniref:putative mycofactocin-associated electron transfer flavoprotein n=1 Tax=Frankia sp. Cas4 TaxID=3073927 RepID=UPI002AD1FC03|nr:putative mycofactocin-associated electron transfer flavoprotein [Frankia sp. Cas4]
MSSSAMAETGDIFGLQVTVLVAHSPLAVEVDPLTGEVHIDERLSGLSAADQAACEWALRLGDAWSVPVAVLTVGPPAADATLRAVLAAGAARAIRVDADADADADPRMVAAGVIAALRRDPDHGDPDHGDPDHGDPNHGDPNHGDPNHAQAARTDIVVAGSWSPRRGSGAVPALVAAGLGRGRGRGHGIGGVAQALGLVSLAPTAPGVVEAERRIDGGRRERLRVRAPAVLSVDPGTAPLRRAGLRAVVAARRAPIDVVRIALPVSLPATRVPLRPRPKVLLPPAATLPARERVRQLTGAGETRGTDRAVVRLDPPQAADRVLAALRAWGYLPAPGPGPGTCPGPGALAPGPGPGPGPDEQAR